MLDIMVIKQDIKVGKDIMEVIIEGFLATKQDITVIKQDIKVDKDIMAIIVVIIKIKDIAKDIVDIISIKDIIIKAIIITMRY